MLFSRVLWHEMVSPQIKKMMFLYGRCLDESVQLSSLHSSLFEKVVLDVTWFVMQPLSFILEFFIFSERISAYQKKALRSIHSSTWVHSLNKLTGKTELNFFIYTLL